MEEITDAIEEAMGIRTHVDIKSPHDPKMELSKQAKNNAKLIEIYKTPFGKMFVDNFCDFSRNPNIRNLLGI